MESTSRQSRVDEYVRKLQPLFDPNACDGINQTFEFVCSLVRVGGVELGDLDPFNESQALVQDLIALSHVPQASESFPKPDRTRARLAIMSYCHLTEVGFFYQLLANLLRVRSGKRFHFDPFRDLWIRRKRGDPIPPSTTTKIRRVVQLATECGFTGLDEIFNDIYQKDIRNAVFHADYALTETDFVMRNKGLYKSRKGYLTPAIEFDELEDLIDRSFAFYSALLSLHNGARSTFRPFQNKLLPFDPHYKGLLELLFEDSVLSGFHVYWPNGSHCEFSRTKEGTRASNLHPSIKGGIELFVGLYASNRGPFSPLVEHDQEPHYTPRQGWTRAPHWPEDLKPYDAE